MRQLSCWVPKEAGAHILPVSCVAWVSGSLCRKWGRPQTVLCSPTLVPVLWATTWGLGQTLN